MPEHVELDAAIDAVVAAGLAAGLTLPEIENLMLDRIGAGLVGPEVEEPDDMPERVREAGRAMGFEPPAMTEPCPSCGAAQVHRLDCLEGKRK